MVFRKCGVAVLWEVLPEAPDFGFGGVLRFRGVLCRERGCVLSDFMCGRVGGGVPPDFMCREGSG